jgi:hypothetical protein
MAESGRRIDQTHKREATHGSCVASVAFPNLPERMSDPSEWVIRPLNATREGIEAVKQQARGGESRARRPLPLELGDLRHSVLTVLQGSILHRDEVVVGGSRLPGPAEGVVN